MAEMEESLLLTKDQDAEERAFREVMESLRADNVSQKVSMEYEKLFKALKQSHGTERRLIQQLEEQAHAQTQDVARVSAALKLGEEDAAAAARLREELQRLQAALKSSQEKEASVLETEQFLRRENSHLQTLVDAGTSLASRDDSAMGALQKSFSELMQEREQQDKALIVARREAAQHMQRVREGEESMSKMELEARAMRDQVAAAKAELDREARKRERAEKDGVESRGRAEALALELRERKQEAFLLEQRMQRMDAIAKEQRLASERGQREHNQLAERHSKMLRELHEATAAATVLKADNAEKLKQLQLKEDALKAVRSDVAKVHSQKEAALAKAKTVEKQKMDMQLQHEELRATVKSKEKELEAQRSRAEQQEKQEARAAQEREALDQQQVKAEDAAHRQADRVKELEHAGKVLEAEVGTLRAEATKLLKQLQAIERDRDAVRGDLQASRNKCADSEAEVSSCRAAAAEHAKQMAELHGRIRHDETKLAAKHAQHSAAARDLVQAYEQILELKRRTRVAEFDAATNTDKAKKLTADLSHTEAEKFRLGRQSEAIKTRLKRLEQERREAETAEKEQEAEHMRLKLIIAEAEKERVRWRRELDQAMGDRDMLGTQLVRRNDELALLYEKLRLQEATIVQGRKAYRDQSDELQQRKLLYADLQREMEILRTRSESIAMLKTEVHHLGRQILQERSKVKVLSKELESPLNVHRWRSLEGSDPGAYELIMKCQALQRRLIFSIEACVEKDHRIAELEKLQEELKAILARQPGPESAILISDLQAQLREKEKQLRGLTSELIMEQAGVEDHKDSMTRLQRELMDMKRLWLEAKRQVHLARQAQAKHFEDENREPKKKMMASCVITDITPLTGTALIPAVH